MQDWTGNTQSVMATLNASSHSEEDRAENDYYATPPFATKALLEREQFNNLVLEPACGEGHISDILKEFGYTVKSSDLIERGYGATQNFFEQGNWEGDIITNPPFSMSQEFTEKAMSLLKEGGKLAMLLRVQFLEGVKRHKMFKEFPPKTIYVFSRNIRCAKNGDFANATGNASTYCWFVWEKGYKGKPSIDWII